MAHESVNDVNFIHLCTVCKCVCLWGGDRVLCLPSGCRCTPQLWGLRSSSALPSRTHLSLCCSAEVLGSACRCALIMVCFTWPCVYGPQAQPQTPASSRFQKQKGLGFIKWTQATRVWQETPCGICLALADIVQTSAACKEPGSPALLRGHFFS